MRQVIIFIHVSVALTSLATMGWLIFEAWQIKTSRLMQRLCLVTFLSTVISGLSLLFIGSSARQICPALGAYTLAFGALSLFAHFIRKQREALDD